MTRVNTSSSSYLVSDTNARQLGSAAHHVAGSRGCGTGAQVSYYPFQSLIAIRDESRRNCELNVSTIRALTELERATHKIRLHVIILPVPVLTSAGSSLLHFHQIPRLGNVITIKIHLPGVLQPCLGRPSDQRGTDCRRKTLSRPRAAVLGDTMLQSQ